MLLSSTAIVGGIGGSAHDFSGEGWADNQICLPCHTPHDADLSVPDAPLWNHAVTTATFQPYANGTINATDLGQPDGVSKLCLSCHDGTVALDSYGSAVGTTFIGDGEPGYIGTDLRNDHPVSFTYDPTLATADGDLHDPTTGVSGLGSTINDDLLFSSKMECASCHDVHNKFALENLVVKDNTGSALCLTCHNK